MATLFRMGTDMLASRWRKPRLTAEQVSGIGTMLEQDVIPKLLVAHSARVPQPVWAKPNVDAEESARIASLATHCEAHILLDLVEEIMQRGVDVEHVLVDLLAPAARHLGREWEVDELDFMQVSMGLWRLQEVMRELTARCPHAQLNDADRSALLLAFPGEDHGFGAAMVQECFALAGWNADLLVGATRSDLLEHVAATHFDIIGVSVSCDCHIDDIAPLIRALKTVSMNPAVRIMIGGRVVDDNPSLAERTGADGTAKTAIDAVRAAEHLVESACVNAAT